MRLLLIYVAMTMIMLGDALSHESHDAPSRLMPGDKDYRHSKYHEPYKRLAVEVNGGNELGPSDYGYRHDELGIIYKELYKSQKCHCQSGHCRPTNVRPSQLDAESGYDVRVDRQWIPVPLDSLQNENSLSADLMAALMNGGHEDGTNSHVCAYKDATKPYGYRIECVVMQFTG